MHGLGNPYVFETYTYMWKLLKELVIILSKKLNDRKMYIEDKDINREIYREFLEIKK